ncbi:MAG: EAL domain-containing protein [Pseudomonadota bacterium]
MSLYKQLWLAIIFILTLVFGGAFLVNTYSAKSYLQQQLGIKNADNANALALSLTQQDADEVLLELTLAAQFDTGFYEYIELTDPDGRVMMYRQDNSPITEAPAWFIALFPLEIDPGLAAIQKGWQQVGTLTLRSHSRFAYAELWQGSQKLAGVFLVAMVLAGSLGTYLLKIILQPLDDVVEQAEAIGERRFISIPEPRTREFRQVVSAMNELSQRIKKVLQAEAKRLEKWQREAHIDKVTALLNREPFVQALDAALESDDVNATGSLSLLRIKGLAELNRNYGRRAIDLMLKDMGTELNRIAGSHSRWAAARMNGSDFGLLAPRSMDAKAATAEAQDAMQAALEKHNMQDTVQLPAATIIYEHGNKLGELLTLLDGALQSAEQSEDSPIQQAFMGDVQVKPVREQLDDWRRIFDRAFSNGDFSLTQFPVVDLDEKLLHFEAPVRLELDGQLLSAGRFLPWINRLELSEELDKQVIKLALQKIEASGEPVAVNLSVAAVVDASFIPWMSQQLSMNEAAAAKLWLELSESMAFRHLDSFKKLCARARSFGTKIGIEHMGHQLAELGQLADVGVDYFKIDASFVRGVDENAANQTLLRTLCTVGHSIGVIVLAEGVRTPEEWAALRELGADGGTGPGIELS